jgi:uncharacterized repeat protein (TIGR03803 family)
MVLTYLGPILEAQAQTLTPLYSFSGGNDGAQPAGLVLSSNTIYGAASYGRGSNYGTVFAVHTDGTGFTVLRSFSGGSDGAFPWALSLSGNTLYGTALYGGLDVSYSGNGTLFALNTDGAGFSKLYSFGGDDGSIPSDLILSSNTLYGATESGGSSGSGTVFRLNPDGTGFATVYSFTARNFYTNLFFDIYTNSDGFSPNGLILLGDALYGTTSLGGSSGNGTVFKVNTDGTSFTVLHSFTGPPVAGSAHPTPNSDGAHPEVGLTSSGNTLYGTALLGGGSGKGTIFKLNIDGTGFMILHSFSGQDGANPYAKLLQSGNTLYGEASYGGNSGNGTAFKLNDDGTGFASLHSFTGGDGANPAGGLLLSSNTLYGTTLNGGSFGSGTLFSISLPVTPLQLTIRLTGANIILTWSTNANGFTLQSTTNLVSPVVWTAVSPEPVVVNGWNTVTNAVSGAQQFYRLSQ